VLYITGDDSITVEAAEKVGGSLVRKALELLVVAVIIGASVAVVGLLRPEVVDAQQTPSMHRRIVLPGPFPKERYLRTKSLP
jgi:hypothetical protein